MREAAMHRFAMRDPGDATQSLRHLPATRFAEATLARTSLVMSGGTEGALTPHRIVSGVTDDSDRQQTVPRARAMASVVPRDLPPEEAGRTAQVEPVMQGVREPMYRAGIAAADEVHFVQVEWTLLAVMRSAVAAGMCGDRRCRADSFIGSAGRGA